MLAWPFIQRELRVHLRQDQRAFSTRNTLVILGGITALMVIYASLSPGTTGKLLHQVIFVTCSALVFGHGSRLATGLFANEQAEGSLGLLYICGLSSMDLLLGKTTGAMVTGLYAFLGCFPMLVLPAIMGGISFELLVLSAVILPVLLFFTVCVAVFAATISGRSGSESIWFTLVFVFFVVVGPVVHFGNLLFGAAVNRSWLGLSPGYPFVEALFNGTAPVSSLAWHGLGWTIVWALILLFAATALIRARWRHEVQGSENSWWQKEFQRLLSGPDDARIESRKKWIDADPYGWLVARDRRPLIVSIVGISVIVFMWFVGGVLWPTGWLNTTMFIATGGLILKVTYSLTTYFAARQLAADRRDGTLELLLVTPLSPTEIVAGQEHALRHQTRWLVKGGFVCCVALAIGGLFSRSWGAGSLFSYAAIWTWILGLIAIAGRSRCSLGMWIALNTGRTHPPARRTIWSSLDLLFWLYWFYCYYQLFNSLPQISALQNFFPTGSTVELVIVIFLSVFGLGLHHAISRGDDEIRARLLEHFREIAAEPVPSPKDPRFAKWDTKERLPAAE